MAKHYWRINEGSRGTPNQLFHHSPWTISLKGEVSAYLDARGVYDYTYGISESFPYWQDDRQPFPSTQEIKISWNHITQASKKCL